MGGGSEECCEMCNSGSGDDGYILPYLHLLYTQWKDSNVDEKIETLLDEGWVKVGDGSVSKAGDVYVGRSILLIKQCSSHGHGKSVGHFSDVGPTHTAGFMSLCTFCKESLLDNNDNDTSSSNDLQGITDKHPNNEGLSAQPSSSLQSTADKFPICEEPFRSADLERKIFNETQLGDWPCNIVKDSVGLPYLENKLGSMNDPDMQNRADRGKDLMINMATVPLLNEHYVRKRNQLTCCAVGGNKEDVGHSGNASSSSPPQQHADDDDWVMVPAGGPTSSNKKKLRSWFSWLPQSKPSFCKR